MGTRDRILDAAAHVMRVHGLARATTREIAKAAGYSEATLYKHFRDKVDLFLAVLAERTPANLRPLLADLPARAGRGTVRDTLVEVARAAIGFYGETFPMAASLFAEPQILAAHRDAVHERGAGPHHVNQALAAYLAAERNLGRIRRECDPEAAATLLLGACFQHAFLNSFSGKENDQESAERLAAALTDTLTLGLSPQDAPPPAGQPSTSPS
ncbi:TetR/AcrR family transcriptional regulator [Streptosporangium sp. NPDC000396]|uniref:TetR/AcrR family transcriptional regulator n=1 Tax=Streptosporangium sp. NPDC000396 TaxID=3366185 RepID=UPI00368D04E5